MVLLSQSLEWLGSGTVVGGLANPATGRTGHATFSAPTIVAVPQSAMHSAENPSCTEEVILQQAQSGGVSALDLPLSAQPRDCKPVGPRE